MNSDSTPSDPLTPILQHIRVAIHTIREIDLNFNLEGLLDNYCKLLEVLNTFEAQ